MADSVQESRKVPMVADSVQESRKVPASVQEAVVAESSAQESRRAVDCRPQAGIAVMSCSWESSGGAASSL